MMISYTSLDTDEPAAGNGELGRELRVRAERISRPATIEEAQQLVQNSHRVHGVGTRHCFNDIADTDGTLINLSALPRTIEISPGEVDHERATVRVDGGITYGELAPELDRQGWALANLASLPHISVAGACATATHGSGDHQQNLAAAVSEIEFITAQGDLINFRRGNADYAAMPVHLGALGLVTELVLDLVPSYQVATTAFTDLRWSTFLDHFDEITAAGYSFSVAPDWRRGGDAMVFLKQISPSTGSGSVAEFYGAKAATTRMHLSPGGDVKALTEQLGIAGPWFDRLPHFQLHFEPSIGEELQSEYLIPREHAVAALEAIKVHRSELAGLAQSTEVRTVAADDLWLSPSYLTDCVGVHFTWVRDQPAVEALLRNLEESLAPYEAKPHWGKLFAAGPDRLRELFPRLLDFASLAARLDPEEKFRNDFLRRNLFPVKQE